MMRTARTAAAIRYTTFFVVVVLILAAAMYALIRENAYARLDQNLSSALGVTSLGIFHEIQEHGGKAQGEDALRQVLSAMYQTSFPQEQIMVREGGRLVAYKPNLGHKQFDLRNVHAAGGPPYANYGDLRVAWKYLYVPEAKTTYTVVVSAWRADIKGDLASVVRALAITIPIAFLIVAIGAYILARRTLAPLTEMAGTVDAITSTSLEKRLRVPDARDEIAQLAIRFNRLLDRLQQAFAHQRRFMADASHELRTPIAAALTASQVTLQAQSRSEDEYRSTLRIVEEQMLRLRRIVQDMFLLAQTDSQSIALKQELLYFDEVVAEACRAVEVLCREKQVKLEVDCTSGVEIYGDPGLLRQCVVVLLDNARKYTPPGGTIRVTLTSNNTRCILRVADTGCGIPPEAQPHIFERFYRVNKARSRSASDVNGGGAGLGLSIAKWIAGMHKGELQLEHSEVGGGSVFALILPVSGPEGTGERLGAPDRKHALTSTYDSDGGLVSKG